MNVNAIKLDEEKCAVIDEKGNVDVISLNSNEQLEKLLLKQNELENLDNEIEECKAEIIKNKNYSIFAEFRNILTYILDVLIFLMCASVIPLPVLLGIVCICHTLIKFANVKTYGTRAGRKITKDTLNCKLKLLEKQIPGLEKQISEIKNNYNYESLTEIKALSNPQIVSYKNQFENIATSEDKPKVLSIGQKKNEK